MAMETVPGAARRARMRDNAELLGKLQRSVSRWLDTDAGQVTLLALAGVTLLLAMTIGP